MKYEKIKVNATRTIAIFDSTYEESYEELLVLSRRMLELLPDPSIGPAERLERIARIVPESMRYSDYTKTARTKLNYLKQRLEELVPEEGETSMDKLEILVDRINKKFPELSNERLFVKLEKMGDNRISDIGR